jgi:hypothetical protein
MRVEPGDRDKVVNVDVQYEPENKLNKKSILKNPPLNLDKNPKIAKKQLPHCIQAYSD